MSLLYLNGILSFSILFIAIFITVYSYLFLSKTENHRERRPWDFLFVSSILFLVLQLISVLIVLKVLHIGALDIVFLSKLFEFLYSGFVLLAFISQHDLILKNHLILISKKDQDPSRADIRSAVVESIEAPKKRAAGKK